MQKTLIVLVALSGFVSVCCKGEGPERPKGAEATPKPYQSGPGLGIPAGEGGQTRSVATAGAAAGGTPAVHSMAGSKASVILSPDLPSTGRPGEGPQVDSEMPLSKENIRPSVLAGSWYDLQTEALARRVEGFLAKVESARVGGYPIALVVPHAGYAFSGEVAAHAYNQIKGRTYGRVFVLGPSHHVGFHGVAVSKHTHYDTPLGRLAVDTAQVERLAGEPLFVRHESAEGDEHSIEIQLPFLQTVLGNRFLLVPLVVGRLADEEVAQVSAGLRKHVRPGDLVVASSDFTHYGSRFDYYGPPGAAFKPEEAPVRLEELLKAAWAGIEKRDPAALLEHRRTTGDTICGVLPIAIVLGALPPETRAQLLKTDTSGRITGDWENSVSYLSAAFTGLWPYASVEGAGALSDGDKAALLKLARVTVDTVVKGGDRPSFEGAGIAVSERMQQPNGAFVTLKKHGDLRGCIGTIMPVKPLVTAVSDNAVNAALYDRRFRPVAQEELAELTVEVSVLTTPRAIGSAEEIVLGKHGVIIEKDGRSAVFLPQVAPEQGWTLDDMLAHLSMKAGLGADAWKSGAAFQVFEAIVFHETERP